MNLSSHCLIAKGFTSLSTYCFGPDKTGSRVDGGKQSILFSTDSALVSGWIGNQTQYLKGGRRMCYPHSHPAPQFSYCSVGYTGGNSVIYQPHLSIMHIIQHGRYYQYNIVPNGTIYMEACWIRFC